MHRWLLIALLAGAPGCGPAAVDYSALRHEAESRLQPAQRRDARSERSLKALLAEPITADSAARIALLNSPGLRASIERLARERGLASSARRLPNPTLEGALRYGHGGDPEIELGAMIDVSDLLLLWSRARAADAELGAAELDAVGAMLDHSFSARRAFYEYQAALHALELRDAMLAAFSASDELSARLREAGNVTELQRVSEQGAFEEAKLSRARAAVRARAARERLAVVLGLSGSAGLRADARLPQPAPAELELGTLEKEAVRRSLDLEIARRRFSAADRRAGLARASGWLPELKAGVTAERSDEWAVGPAVELELPLFYQGQGEASAVAAEARQQYHTVLDVWVRVRSRAREVAERLRVAREGVQRYERAILPLRQRLLDETLLHYNAMTVSPFQLLQAKREQIAAQSAYADQLEEYWKARLAAEQLLAGRLDEGAALGAELPRDASPSASGGGH